MGLMAGLRAVKEGHEVDLLEAGPEPGGMAAHFDFNGVSLERFYHFLCRTDEPTFAALRELGIADKLQWRDTSMGFFNDGKLYKWGDPIALLTFPKLGLVDKIRYGLFAMTCVRRNHWDELEHESAKDWITRYCGQNVYDKLWKPLFAYKFYEYADNISAAWIWTRIRRVGRSRKSMFQEQMGVLEGGSVTLVNALAEAFTALGGRIHLSSAAEQVIVTDNAVTGVRTVNGETLPADQVISTTPTPYLSAMIPDLPEDWKAKYDSIANIGVICVIFKLAKSVTPHFWVNVSEPDIQIPGIIEFSNLRDFGDDRIVYIPYYMPTTNEKFTWPDEALVSESFTLLKRINPELTDADIRDTKVARLRYGQPICDPSFLDKLPPIKAPIDGLQIADTCSYYPEDRGIAESLRVGDAMARSINSGEFVNPRPEVYRPEPARTTRA